MSETNTVAASLQIEWKIGAYKIVYARDATVARQENAIALFSELAKDIEQVTNQGVYGILNTDKVLGLAQRFGASHNFTCTARTHSSATPKDPITFVFSLKMANLPI